MNRKEEFEAMLSEFEKTDLDYDVMPKAEKRLKKRKYFYVPVSYAASFFICFVVLVNFCSPVAYGCSKLPLIKDLAKAVTFSPSLSSAVDNEYLQKVGIIQNKNGISASVDYIIVDQKQVNIFFRLDGSGYGTLSADPDISGAEGEFLESCSYGVNGYNVPNGEINSLTIDFINGNVPDSLMLKLKVYENESSQSRVPETEKGYFEDWNPDYIAEFEFLLEFDPQFTAVGKEIKVNEEFEIEGQKFVITDIEIYPTNMRINISADEKNTAWIKELYFEAADDRGRRFEPVANGISATGDLSTPMMKSYRAESPYFYDSDFINIIIKGAVLLDKNNERVFIDLKNSFSGNMPQDAELYRVYRENGTWIVETKCAERKENHMHQIFMGNYYDLYGNEYHINGYGSAITSSKGEEEKGFFYSYMYLNDYPYDKVWLEAAYSRICTLKEEKVIKIINEK